MSSITFDELIQAGLETTTKELIIKLFENNKEEFFYKVCKSGNIEIVKLLIEHGANVNSYDYNPLIEASRNGHLEVVKLLIAHGADVKSDNNDAIRRASLNGHLEVVKLLIEHGADVKSDNNDAIRWASENGNVEVVKLLIEHGADVKANDNYAIKWASANGHLEVVKLLIKHGADVSKINIHSTTPNIRNYLLSLIEKNKCTYYGIVSEEKLDIKLPNLQELIKDNLYYYVYKCETKNGCFIVPDIISKHTILSNLNLGIVYSIGFFYDI